MPQFTTPMQLLTLLTPLELWLYDTLLPCSPDFMSLEELFAQVNKWMKENDAAWQFCRDPALMIEEAFLQVTEEVRNYIKHAEYF